MTITLQQELFLNLLLSIALSMLGEAINFHAQFWYILIVGILNAIFKGPLLREVATTVKLIDFLIIPPVIHIKTSEPIKNFLIQRTQSG